MPVHSLKRLMFEKDISVAAVEKMLSEEQDYQLGRYAQYKKIVSFYTVMYWEAPEEVVIHFLGQLPPNCKHTLDFILRLSRSTKYSIELWGRLVKWRGMVTDDSKAYFKFYRPDLLSLCN